MQLPVELSTEINRLLEGRSRKDLAERSARISSIYRGGGGSKAGVQNDEDALAYVLSRLPATYAATRQVMERLQERSPEFSPRSAWDLGAGPGTASWALADAWPQIETITQVDHNQRFLVLGRTLAQAAPSAALRQATQVAGDIVHQLDADTTSDLIVLSYALAEFTPSAMETLLRRAWEHCAGAIAIVEPGTPEGYDRVLRARTLLMTLGARILAPCPHEHACPLERPDWCHFAQRVSRTRDHMIVKGASLSYEDEKFAYLIAVREPWFVSATADRILARTEVSKAGFSAKVCRVDGTAERVRIGRREKAWFARVRKLDWGDELQPVSVDKEARYESSMEE